MTPRHCLLDRIACIAVRGADAQPFLHAQLSSDIAKLDGARAPLAGWLDAKGRVRALFRVLRQPEQWILTMPLDMLDTVVPKLRLYVLRAAVEVAPAYDLHAAAVLDADDWAAARGVGITAADSTMVRGQLHWVRVGPGLLHVFGAASALETALRDLDTAPSEHAELAAIRLGLPIVTRTLSERFVAQMLNLDCIGAVSFTKGCYPGQEIVARVHNLGSVKRRLRRYSARGAEAPAAGTQVRRADGTAVGEVIRAAHDAGRVEVLAVVDHEAVGGELAIAADLALTLEPLPYDVPAR